MMVQGAGEVVTWPLTEFKINKNIVENRIAFITFWFRVRVRSYFLR